MHIVICEDTENDLRRLEELVRTAIFDINLDAKLTCFSSGEELLRAVGDGFSPSVCFLDVYMQDITGVDTARKLKQTHPNCAMVFVTSSPDHMADGFDIGAVHYLLKPASREQVETALQRAISAVGFETRYVELTVNRKPIRILLGDILYVETQGNYCHIFLRGSSEPQRVYMRLDELENMLSQKRFLRCHYSFIVNLDAVTASTEDGCFLLQGGAKVPIRQRGRKEILNAYSDYYFEWLRRGDL